MCDSFLLKGSKFLVVSPLTNHLTESQIKPVRPPNNSKSGFGGVSFHKLEVVSWISELAFGVGALAVQRQI